MSCPDESSHVNAPICETAAEATGAYPCVPGFSVIVPPGDTQWFYLAPAMASTRHRSQRYSKSTASRWSCTVAKTASGSLESLGTVMR